MSGPNPAIPAGHFNAITLIRWFFALTLVYFHACIVSGVAHSYYPPIGGHAIVSVFFMLSGMLSYEGYQKHPGARRFYLRRLRRLFPPYAAVVIGFALLLAAASSLSPAAYFSAPAFWKYLAANLSFLNFLAPQLPGVFADNAVTAVNSSLWTMKVEVMFYTIVPLLVWLARRYGAAKMIVAAYLLSVAYNIVFVELYHAGGLAKFDILRRQMPGQLMYFAAGMAAVHLRARLLSHKYLFGLSGLLVWFVCGLFATLRPIEPLAIAAALTTFAYGFRRLSAIAVRVPNLTYEVYLLHFPVMQVFVSVGLFSAIGFLPTFATTLLVVLLLSAAMHRVFSK